MIPLSHDCRELLDHQNGVLARWQAADHGLAPAAIGNLLRGDRWRPLYRGVYCTYTGEPTRRSLLWAGALRCGPDAALSHFSAAELEGIRGRRTEAIHVTIPGHQRIRFGAHELTGDLPRLVVHRSNRINSARHPAKTPPRTRVEETILDLTDLAHDIDEVFSWLSAACAGRHTTPGQLASTAACRARLRWREDVLAALGEVSGGVHTILERRYVTNVERPHGLPKSQRQVKMRRGSGTAYLDNSYAGYGVVVELDGLAYHLVEDRWHDIHKDNYLARAGIIVLRYSWADIIARPCEVATEIALVLRRRGWNGTLGSCGVSCRAAAA